MRHDVEATNWQNRLYVRGDRLRIGGRVVVHPLGEGIEIGPERRLLRVVPHLRSRRHIVLEQPDGRRLVLLAPVFSASSTRLAVEAQNLVGVALRLRVPVTVEDRGGILAVDMRNAVLV